MPMLPNHTLPSGSTPPSLNLMTPSLTSFASKVSSRIASYSLLTGVGLVLVGAVAAGSTTSDEALVAMKPGALARGVMYERQGDCG